MERGGGTTELIKGVGKWINRSSKNYLISLWIRSIKIIEGRFGTAVASYFVLNRWVFLLNIMLALIWFAFIIVPGIFGMSQKIVDRSITTNNFQNDSGIQNITLIYYNSTYYSNFWARSNSKSDIFTGGTVKTQNSP